MHTRPIACPRCAFACAWGTQRCPRCQTWVVVDCVFCGALSPHDQAACLACREPFSGAMARKQQRAQRRAIAVRAVGDGFFCRSPYPNGAPLRYRCVVAGQRREGGFRSLAEQEAFVYTGGFPAEIQVWFDAPQRPRVAPRDARHGAASPIEDPWPTPGYVPMGPVETSMMGGLASSWDPSPGFTDAGRSTKGPKFTLTLGGRCCIVPKTIQARPFTRIAAP